MVSVHFLLNNELTAVAPKNIKVVNAKCPLGPYGSSGALPIAEGGETNQLPPFLDSFQLVSEIEFFLPSPVLSKTTLLREMIPEGATT
jgi:hypothetical protein